jgi:hypothetical protein
MRRAKRFQVYALVGALLAGIILIGAVVPLGYSYVIGSPLYSMYGATTGSYARIAFYFSDGSKQEWKSDTLNVFSFYPLDLTYSGKKVTKAHFEVVGVLIHQPDQGYHVQIFANTEIQIGGHTYTTLHGETCVWTALSKPGEWMLSSYDLSGSDIQSLCKDHGISGDFKIGLTSEQTHRIYIAVGGSDVERYKEEKTLPFYKTLHYTPPSTTDGGGDGGGGGGGGGGTTTGDNLPDYIASPSSSQSGFDWTMTAFVLGFCAVVAIDALKGAKVPKAKGRRRR